MTVTHTTDLVVHYHGRAINTQLLEEEVGSLLEMSKKFREMFILLTALTNTCAGGDIHPDLDADLDHGDLPLPHLDLPHRHPEPDPAPAHPRHPAAAGAYHRPGAVTSSDQLLLV